MIVEGTRLKYLRQPRFNFDPPPRVRWSIVVITVLSLALVVGWGSWFVYHTNPNRKFDRAILLKDRGRYPEACAGFQVASRELDSSDRAQSAAYYMAITYYLEQKAEGVEALREVRRRHPDTPWAGHATERLRELGVAD